MAGKKDKEAAVDAFPTSADAAEAPSPAVPERVPNAPTPMPPTTLEGVLARQAAPACEKCGGTGVSEVGGPGRGDAICPTCRGTGKTA